MRKTKLAGTLQASVATGNTQGLVSKRLEGPAVIKKVSIAASADVNANSKVYIGVAQDPSTPASSAGVGTNLLFFTSSNGYVLPGKSEAVLEMNFPLKEGPNYLKAYIDNSSGATVVYRVSFEVEFGRRQPESVK